MKIGMNKKMGLVALTGLCMAAGAHAEAVDLSALAADITSNATAVTGIVTTAIIAGFGIFALVWGARKAKSGLSGV